MTKNQTSVLSYTRNYTENKSPRLKLEQLNEDLPSIAEIYKYILTL